ncbi:hypothetical protein PLESTM_001411900, partial [Pleodorina starrii]
MRAPTVQRKVVYECRVHIDDWQRVDNHVTKSRNTMPRFFSSCSCLVDRAATLILVSIMATSFFWGVGADHFRAGMIEYRLSENRSYTLEVSVTTSWRADEPYRMLVQISPYMPVYDAYSENGKITGYGFITFRKDVVGYGSDAAGNEYVTLRTTGYIAVPSEEAEIFAESCCRIAGLVGFGSANSSLQGEFKFATKYVPGVRSSIQTLAPAVFLIGYATRPEDYVYVLVPAVSSSGAPINCSINTDIAYVAP